jgi:hypothetical protein
MDCIAAREAASERGERVNVAPAFRPLISDIRYLTSDVWSAAPLRSQYFDFRALESGFRGSFFCGNHFCKSALMPANSGLNATFGAPADRRLT